MSAPASLRVTFMAAMVLAATGCTQPGGSGGAPASPQSAGFAHCPAQHGSAWATYSDSLGRFSVPYPPGFTFEPQPYGASGVDESYRAVETCYLKIYAPGQLEVTVYVNDADSLGAWIDKHTGGPAFISTNQYFSAVTHEAPARLAGRDVMTFDWQPDATPHTVHNTAMLLGSTFVLVVGWWMDDAPGLDDPSARAAYAAMLKADYGHMLAELHLG